MPAPMMIPTPPAVTSTRPSTRRSDVAEATRSSTWRISLVNDSAPESARMFDHHRAPASLASPIGIPLAALSCSRIPATLNAHEHDLAYDAAFPEQLVRVPSVRERKSPRDERLDPLLLQEREEGDQILAEPCRSQPLQPLDA